MAKMHHRHHARAIHPMGVELEPRDAFKTVETVVFVTASKTFDGPVAGFQTLDPGDNKITVPKHAVKGVPHKHEAAKDVPHKHHVIVGVPHKHEANAGHPLHNNILANNKTPQKGHPLHQNAQSSFPPGLGPGWTAIPSTTSSSSKTSTSSTSIRIPVRTHKPYDKHIEHAPKGSPLRQTASTTSHSHTTHVPVRSHRPAHVTSHSTTMKGTPLSHPGAAKQTTITGHPLQQNSSMSTGEKTGLAVGIILIIGLIAGLGFLWYRRKNGKNDSHQKLDDEKSNPNSQQAALASHVSVRRPNKEAPRLSLRPMTELMFASSEERANHANALFGTGRSATVEEPINEKAAMTANPFEDSSVVAPVAPAAAAPKPLNVQPNTSPTPSDGSGFSSGRNSPAPPHGSPRGSAGPPLNNVHRVQLDFKPSMDDELELKAGQVVRMLHEYDDGWALCIRLDRSQQGVVPRTCISKLPIKPRPRGPPQSGSRGPRGAPPSGQGKRMSPTESLSSISSGSSDSRQQAPYPDNRARAQSNAPYPARSQSPSSAGSRPRSSTSGGYPDSRRITPPSPLNPASSQAGGNVPIRKPVPGQAM